MKIVGYFNLLGVLALGILCAAQWQVNRNLNLKVISLEKTRARQDQKIAEQDKRIEGDAADLQDLRERLEQSDKSLREAQATVTSLQRDVARATAERDRALADRKTLLDERERVKTILDQYVAAVAQRDGVIKQANIDIQGLVDQRNDAIARFNSLATQYNAMVKEENDARAK